MAYAPGIPFRKMNGLGNDFVVLDARHHSIPLSDARARAIADRSTGIGCDQVILLESSANADVGMRIWNSQGGEVESCGNASRCVANLLFGETGRSRVTIDTRGGLLVCTQAGAGLVTVDMGVPRLRWDEIPLAEEFIDTRRIELQVGPIDNPILHTPSAVNVGNPHCIFWVDDPGRFDLAKIGPLLEHHPLFPAGANVSLAQVTAPDHMILKVWERGAGLTRACGTAACAAVVAAARLKLTARKVRVRLPGGELTIDWSDNDHVLMTGPFTHDFDGEVPTHLMAATA
jgi:diaminopimelate epimerase